MPSWDADWRKSAKGTCNEYPVMRGLRLYGLHALYRSGRVSLLLG